MGLWDYLTGNKQQLPVIQVQEGNNGGAALVQSEHNNGNLNPSVLTARLINSTKNAGHKLSNALLGKPQVQQSNLYNYLINDPVSDYQDYLKQNGYDDKVVNGVKQGLNHGYKEIDDWIKQYNSGAGASNPINIPQTQEDINLARQGLYNQSLSPQTSFQTGNGIPVEKRIGGAIPDMINGFRENFNNGFNFTNWGNNDLENERSKGLMFRAGEGLGSIARLINSPLGRGLTVAGLVGLSGGTGVEAAGYGLQTAVNNQQNVMNDRFYRQALIDNYGYTPEQLNQVIGYIGKDTYKNLADTSYRNQLNTYRNRNLDQTTYVKMVKELDTLHKSGQISDDAYLTALRDLNTQYTDSNTYDIGSINSSNDTRKADSQIQLNDARIDNINNPKPRVNISYRYGNSNVNYNHAGNGNDNKSEKNNSKPIGISNNGSNKVKMRYNGRLYNVDANRVQEYIDAGGEVVQ